MEALKRNPTFNAHWTDDGLLAKRRINIGVAVAVDDGLIVPVIRDADQLSIHGLNQPRSSTSRTGRARTSSASTTSAAARSPSTTPAGSASNLTMPIINVPEVGILTMEAITKRAVVV